MITGLTVYETASTRPWHNIAMEEWLMGYVSPGECILYLWQNENTVVVGRNQNIFDECRLAELTGAGGTPARRLSGGGAVYHDMGNQNFTFIVKKDDYDVDRQTAVIIEMARLLGIDAERTGRNDITAGGRKFSGHAFYRSGDVCYHHGTLMVNVELDRMSRFLRPSPEKLRSKGVQSVRSRVANLAEFHKGLTAGDVRAAMRQAFSNIYDGIPVSELAADAVDGSAVARLEKKFSSAEWLYNRVIEAEYFARKRFSWGEASVAFKLEDGIISDAVVSSDGLEADLIAAAPGIITGCRPDNDSLWAAFKESEGMLRTGERAVADDLIELITGAAPGAAE